MRGKQVREFHERQNFAIDKPFPPKISDSLKSLIKNCSGSLKPLAKLALDHSRDRGHSIEDGDALIAMRVHLIAEEVAELLDALAECNEVEALDAVCDTEYVIDGLAVVYGWPIQQAFDEVQRSNMSKQPSPKDKDAARLRDKGPNYSPPDIQGVLARHRARPHGTHAGMKVGCDDPNCSCGGGQ